MTVMQDYHWIFWDIVGSWNNLTSFDCLCYRKENNMNLYYNSNEKLLESIDFLFTTDYISNSSATPMQLKQKSLEFINHYFGTYYGYTPEKMTIDNPDGSKSTAYLMPSRNGMEPWGIQQIEEYVSFMTGGTK